jgi:type IV secretion system protein VirB9
LDVDQTVQGRATVVLVKARECDVSTNLVLMTDRRRYVVDLEAPPCRGTSARQDYMPGIRFWYPDDANGGAGGAAPLLNASRVNATYRWGERRGLFGLFPGRRYRWSPVQVMDDGQKTVFRFSPAARAIGMPTLYAVIEDGSREWVNTTIHPDPAGDVVTADRVAGRWVLVLRAGKSEHTLEVTNNAKRR